MITEQQYQRLKKEYHKSGSLGHAAMLAGMHRETARRYVSAKARPAELQKPHDWRTRTDPLKEIWPETERWLRESPEIEAKALFEHLLATFPGRIEARALRTFQRRISEWLHRNGPPKEVFFAQSHTPGEAIQTDWTCAKELEVCISGQAFPHLLCHSVLPYSNWEWAIPCRSESALSLKLGLQASLWELGGTPLFSQTDQSSTATHQLKRGESRRGFNVEYLALCAHLGLEPRTIAVGSPNQNGDIEAAQGVIKRRLKNQLILRGSRDFPTQEEYASFVAKVCRAANALRQTKTDEERAHLRPLPVSRFPVEQELAARVSSYSTVRVKECVYSVPSRLIGATIQARLSEQSIRFLFKGEEVAACARGTPRSPRIDYRHLIDSLLRKPGAFARYIYREELFPSTVFRQAYDKLLVLEERKASARYLELLKLAAAHGEDVVAGLLGIVMREGVPPFSEHVEARLQTQDTTRTPVIEVFTPDLHSYDALITGVAS